MPNSTIASKIWHGNIPIEFCLDVRELAAANITERVEPCFMLVRRCTYLAMLTGQLRQLLVERRLPFIGDDTDIWYSNADDPLRWHYPIGLLHDLAGANDCHTHEHPWRVTLHTQGYPRDQLKLPPPSLPATRDIFMSMIKESDFVRHGSAKKVMRLPKQEQQQLWHCLDSGDFQGFWAVNRQLMMGGCETDASLSDAMSSSAQSDLRQVPVRIYVPGCPILQEAVNVSVDSEVKPWSMYDMLHSMLPLLFPTASLPMPGEDEDDADEFSSMSTERVELAAAILHGVPLPLDMPLTWAARHLAYADNFLHIVIRFRREVSMPNEGTLKAP